VWDVKYFLIKNIKILILDFYFILFFILTCQNY
jgi:hypothetical protein